MGTFQEVAENAAPHELIVHTNEIEGRAPGKSTKNISETDEKTVKKLGRKSEAFFFILAPIWEAFGSTLGLTFGSF